MNDPNKNGPKTMEFIVSGMTCQGCVNAVTRIIKRLDPGASVHIDLPSGKVEAMSTANSAALASAVTAGGYEAKAV